MGELRQAARSLLRSKRFLLLAASTLAVGIGAASTIYSAADAAVFHPFPALDHPERVVWLTEVDPQNPGEASDTVHKSAFDDWKRAERSFAAFSTVGGGPSTLGDTEPVPVDGWEAGADYFRVTGVQPLLGRGFVADDEQHPAVMLTDRLWRRAFAADPLIVGRKLVLDGRAHTVVGVLRPDFHFYGDPDLFAAHTSDGERFPVIARLRAGVSVQQAQAELDAISAERKHRLRVRLEPVSEYIGAPSRPAIFALLGAVGFVLLIAGANLASLQLVRGLARGRELAVRQSLGASRARIVRQLVFESFIVAAVGGALGLGLAALGVELLRAGHADQLVRHLPQVGQLRIDGRVVGFAIALGALCGLISGLPPALAVSRLDLQSTLKQGGGAGIARRPRRATAMLVTAQVALAMVLLVAAGATTQAFVNLLVRPLGFDPEGLSTLDLRLHARSQPARAQFVEALEMRTSAAAATGLPQTRWQRWNVAAENNFVQARTTAVTPRYFETLHIPLVRGRVFLRSEPVPVAMIDRHLAVLLYGTDDVVGRMLRIEGEQSRQIVGVVGEVAQSGEEVARTRGDVYAPYSQLARPMITLIARGGVDVRAAVREIDPQLAVGDPVSLEDRMGSARARDRLLVGLMAALAVIALLLATIGLGAVVAYAAEQRTQEIGIRLALGAPGAAILKLTLREGLVIGIAGTLVGAVLAPAALRVVRSFTILDGTPWLALLGAVLLLGLSALFASLLPARRALATSPLIALRREGP
jgi:predicted permease